MIATWPLGTPAENARAIRCMFACRDALDAAASDLMDRHGHIPAFRAGVHSGPLVAGEIGGFKREIALVGDTMNTAARIEQACRTTGHPVLASKPLLDRTVKPANIVATSIGGHLLRGKSECLELFALERSTTDRVESHDRGARPFAEADAGDAGGRVSGIGGSRGCPGDHAVAGSSVGGSGPVSAEGIMAISACAPQQL